MFPVKQDGFASNALLYPNGKVLWVPDGYIEARCQNEGLNQGDPWADQTCMLKYGSWTFDGITMDMEFYKDEESAIDGSDWSDSCPMKVTG